MSRPDWIRIIHVAKTQLRLSDEVYQSILEGVGVGSSKELSSLEQFQAVMKGFEALGFKKKTKLPVASLDVVNPDLPNSQHDRASKRQIYYIKGLWALSSRRGDEKSLSAMIKRIGHVDRFRFLSRKKASCVILALRDICVKSGFDPDSKVGGDASYNR